MSVDISQYIAAYETYRLDMSMFFSVAALVAYEHVITFQQEVDLYWKRKFKISTAVFLANRYLGLIFFGFLEYIPLRPELIRYPTPWMNFRMSHSPQYLFSCSATYYSAALANGLIYLPWAVFSALRGYALSQNIWLGFTIFVLSAFPFGTDCYANFQGLTIYVDPTYGCIPNVTISDTYVKYANLFTRVPLVIADLIVVTITWAATYKASKEASVFGSQPSITKILFRDGNVYFIILSLVNILHLIFSIVSIGRTDTTIHQSTLVIWIPAFTTILVSRFMLDLQAVTQNQAHQQSLSSFGSVYFNHFVGSLGASLPAPGEGAQMDEQGQPPDECSIED